MLQALATYDAHNPLAIEDIAARYPTIAKAEAAPGLSARYAPISTLDTVRQLTQAGYAVHGVQVSRVRSADKKGYEQHVLRMRAPGHIGDKVGDYFPEIVARNSHDGTGAWSLSAGMFRLICKNGMTVGTQWGMIRVRHTGDVTQRVLSATSAIADTFGKLADVVDAMRSKVLTREQQLDMAREAHALRFPTASAPVTAERLLTPHRFEDASANDVWTVFNRLQENTVRGGLQGMRTVNGRERRATTRGVNGIDANLALNRGLFDIAERALLAA